MLWLLNRARSNPTQEGIWLATMSDPDVAAARSFWGVDLGVLQAAFAAIGAYVSAVLTATHGWNPWAALALAVAAAPTLTEAKTTSDLLAAVELGAVDHEPRRLVDGDHVVVAVEDLDA